MHKGTGGEYNTDSWIRVHIKGTIKPSKNNSLCTTEWMMWAGLDSLLSSNLGYRVRNHGPVWEHPMWFLVHSSGQGLLLTVIMKQKGQQNWFITTTPKRSSKHHRPLWETWCHKCLQHWLQPGACSLLSSTSLSKFTSGIPSVFSLAEVLYSHWAATFYGGTEKHRASEKEDERLNF